MREKKAILVREIRDGNYARDFLIVGQASKGYEEGQKLTYLTQKGEECQLTETIISIIKNPKHPKYPDRIKIVTDKGNTYIVDTFN